MIKKLFLIASLIFGGFYTHAESSLTQLVVLTPYVENNANTPSADKVLLNKLNQIVMKYGIGSSHGLPTPFIITGNAIEMNQDCTATVPSRIAVKLNLTLYIGNGEEDLKFSSCSFDLRGVGETLDKAYASAFSHLKIDDPKLIDAIDEGKLRISDYYQRQGTILIGRAKMMAAAGNYPDAYAMLLQIPPVCRQYEEAQNIIMEMIHSEFSAANSDVINRARAAWSASPDRRGAHEAKIILAELENPDDKMRGMAEQLMNEMMSKLQISDEQDQNLRSLAEKNRHSEKMEAIKAASKIASQLASKPVYAINWW